MHAFHRQFDARTLHTFEHHLSNCPGSWTMERAFMHAGDPRIIAPRWILPNSPWGDPSGYLTFLDTSAHRKLLRCFVQQTKQKNWHVEQLHASIGSTLSTDALHEALLFCEQQAFVEKQKQDWQAGPMLLGITNFGATFEWMVQETLQAFHHAVALRCVVLKELQQKQLGDLDVLAFTEEGLSVMVECKSSTASLSRQPMQRFVQRVAAFPTDVALLLIDTQDKQAITSRLDFLVDQYAHSKNLSTPVCCEEEGAFLYHLPPNIFLASTRGGVQAPLRTALTLAARAKGSCE
jgi:hypothetical protein